MFKSSPLQCKIFFRFSFTRTQLQARGLVVFGTASDADSRLLKTMRLQSELGTAQNVPESWQGLFCCSFKSQHVNFQDFLHIESKVRKTLLESHFPKKFGDEGISLEHVRVSLTNISVNF